MDNEQWQKEVDQLFKDKYGLDPQDVYAIFESKETPEEYVERIAEKYDLDKLNFNSWCP